MFQRAERQTSIPWWRCGTNSNAPRLRLLGGQTTTENPAQDFRNRHFRNQFALVCRGFRTIDFAGTVRLRRHRCDCPEESSYFEHDSQKCRTPSPGRNDSDNSFPSVDIGFRCHQCPARRGSCGSPVLGLHLCLWLLLRGSVLLRVSSSAVMSAAGW